MFPRIYFRRQEPADSFNEETDYKKNTNQNQIQETFNCSLKIFPRPSITLAYTAKVNPQTVRHQRIQQLFDGSYSSEDMEQNELQCEDDLTDHEEGKLINYTDLKDCFFQLCESAEKNSDNSNLYNTVLQDLEITLGKIKKLADEDSNLQQEMTEMEKKFESLYLKIPLGKSVLLQKDCSKIKQLFLVKKNETYNCKMKGYYEPKVSVKEFSNYFKKFCEKWNFSGISTNMKTNQYYENDYEEMVTTITFIKAKPSVFSLPEKGWLVESFFPHKEENDQRDKETQLEELASLALAKLSDWRFSAFDVDDVENRFSHLDIPGLKRFGCYLILHHRRVEDS